VDGLWAAKSDGVGLIDRALSFQDFQSTLGEKAVKYVVRVVPS